jgi:NitT/TauT family transport system substrate-binding protein
MKRRNALAAAFATLATAAWPARAQATTKIVFGYTAVTDFASVFVAAEEGYFRQRKLDVEL